ncbi:hypothetical protein FRX31_027423 [Thalictrum thalictroides]|uniref:Uncharacterized protein n=1 Tax=Thalictrum thalictroides TaxID=46969 RepID=A0A7J6VFJ7_THATH|nr:hypothetical protein FRX31_027423 [Thalictrum thalictroides]
MKVVDFHIMILSCFALYFVENVLAGMNSGGGIQEGCNLVTTRIIKEEEFDTGKLVQSMKAAAWSWLTTREISFLDSF